MDVERDLLGVGAPVLVAEAVGVFAIDLSGKGMTATRHAFLINFVIARRIRDLEYCMSGTVNV